MLTNPPEPFPGDLAPERFSVGEALGSGVSVARLRRTDLWVPHRGARSRRPAADIDDAARDAAVVLPRPFAFSHLTAARLWRLPLPDEWEAAELVHVVRPTALTQVRRPGVSGHRGLERRSVVSLRGHVVTDPAWTWADLASVRGMSIEALVIAGDAFASRIPGLLEQMRSLAAGRAVRRGVLALREAAALMRVGSESPMETVARLAFHRAGLPEPELNATVHDHGGAFVGRVDFLWRKAKVIVEYEGDQHRTDQRQWRHDIARVRRLQALGYTVIRVTAQDLRDPATHATLVRHLHDLVGE